MSALTPRQAAFVREYLVDLNSTQAAIRAGYSARTAKQQGSRLMTNADVQSAIQAAQASREQRTEITADRVVAELARVAFGDVRRLYRGDGSLIGIPDLGDDAAALIGGFEVQRSGSAEDGFVTTSKVKVNDRLRALEMLGRHLGMFSDNVNLKHAFAAMPAIEVKRDDAGQPVSARLTFDIGSPPADEPDER